MSDLGKESNHRDLSLKRIQLIAENLNPVLAQVFGYNALLYSDLAYQLSGDALRIKQQLVIGPQGNQLTVKCRFEELPVAADCIDLALLPAILQQSNNPHQILREVERVLIPEGVLVVIGRNPLSWYGIKHWFGQRRIDKLKKHKDISRTRLADWFRLLGLETESTINISMTNEKLQKSNAYPWVRRVVQLFCDYFCSYYIIVARKKVSTLTPIRPSWRRNKQLVPPRLAEPSVTSQVENWFKQLYKALK
ncbi:class I SAM-dependent methyltransferase [Aliikangiella maris]|uniref:Methyltransferase domain-containing protein n=2 Tax=Aliikangiella maris TaxID=3162458 RepID=A0ABV3MML5_9GAMM